MHSRSFHPVMTFITFMLMLFGLASGCVSDPVTTDQTTQSATTTPNSVEETGTATDPSSEPPSGPKSEQDINLILAELGVDPNAQNGSKIDVPLTDEEFFKLAVEFDFPIDYVEELDTGGCGGAVPPPLSSSCSISYTDEDIAYDYNGYTYASCYNYYAFPADSGGESDCYIKFYNNWPGSTYFFDDINACATAASVRYGGQLTSYDTSSYVYIRLDSRWCRYSNCEDGFKIY